MYDRRETTKVRAWCLRALVMCCCVGIASAGYGESAYRPNNPAQSADKRGVEHQLRQLKQALMTLAMDQKARVAASGWTDRNGALNEDLMVFSGLALEKLRPIVRRNRFGVETTELVYAAETSDETCEAAPIRMQRLGLTVTVERQGPADGENMARAAARLLQQRIHAKVAQSNLSNVGAVLTTEPTQSSRKSTYLRYMTASPASSQDLHLDLQVRTAERKPPLHRYGLVERVRPDKTLEVGLNLMAQGVVVLSLQTDVLLPSSRQSANDQLAWLTLPQVTKQSLVDWLDEVLPDIAQAVNCYGESGLAIAANASEMRLLGGRDAGVYQGQRMAILPTSRRLSVRGLEQSLTVVGLAEVTEVGPRSATLTMYAGPSRNDTADMMAVPIAAFTP